MVYTIVSKLSLISSFHHFLFFSLTDGRFKLVQSFKMNVQSTQPTDSTDETFGKIYTKLPRSVNLKIGLVALLVILGLVGLPGNSLIHYFVSKKKSFPLLQSTPFVRNFNL